MNFSKIDSKESLCYRPPEVLVQGVADVLACGTGDRSLAAVDMWAVGCIFAEFVIGAPLFETAETSFDLLSLHCDWLGFTYTSPDGYLEIRSPDSEAGRPKLAELVPGLFKHGYDLLSRLLACDYTQRITADEASKHPFFSACFCEMTRTKRCVEFLSGLKVYTRMDCEEFEVDDDQRTPMIGDQRERSWSFETYPSFLHRVSSEGSQELPSFIQELVEKRRLKRQRTEEPYRDAAPAI